MVRQLKIDYTASCLINFGYMFHIIYSHRASKFNIFYIKKIEKLYQTVAF